MSRFLWGAHAPRVLISAPPPKFPVCPTPSDWRGRQSHHARARAPPRFLGRFAQCRINCSCRSLGCNLVWSTTQKIDARRSKSSNETGGPKLKQRKFTANWPSARRMRDGKEFFCAWRRQKRDTKAVGRRNLWL